MKLEISSANFCYNDLSNLIEMNLYIYLDESGNFDFSHNPGATEWIMLSSLSTTNPEEGVLEHYRAKHELIADGYDISCFHATEDKQVVRDRFFKVIETLREARVDGLAIRKRRLAPKWREQKGFYPNTIEYLLRYVLHPYGMDATRFDKIIIFLAKMQLPKGQRDTMLGGIKGFLSRHLGGTPYIILFHPVESHPYLQMADYCCWALYVRHERNEVRPYRQISHLVSSDYDIFEPGAIDWY